MTSSPGAARAGGAPRPQLVGAVVVTVPLTVAAAAVGGRRWPLPRYVAEGWQVAAVPVDLAALLAVSIAVCLVAATAFTLRVTRLRLPEPAGIAWLGVVLGAAAFLGWYALLLAANGGRADFGPYIPALDWTFTAVPALAAGGLTARRGPAVATLAAAGTGVLTLPLYTLGIALLGSRDPFAAYLWSPLWAGFAVGALPLVVAAVLSWGWGHRRSARREEN